MKKQDVQREPKTDAPKTVQIKLRASQHQSDWLTEENLSPQKIWDAACKELGYKPDLKLKPQKSISAAQYPHGGK